MDKSIKLGIFKLERNDTPMGGEMTACIVVASTEKEARQVANGDPKAEGYIWTDGHKVSVTRVGTADPDTDMVGMILFSTE